MMTQSQPVGQTKLIPELIPGEFTALKNYADWGATRISQRNALKAKPFETMYADLGERPIRTPHAVDLSRSEPQANTVVR